MTSLVIAEHDNASIKGATLNTVTAAAACGGDVHVLVAGHNAGAAAAAAAQIAGVSKVIHAEGEGFAHGLAENVAAQVLAKAPDALALPDDERRETFRSIGVDLMFTHIKASLHEFGTDFDVYTHEDSMHTSGRVDQAIAKLRAARRIWARARAPSPPPPRPLQRRAGSARRSNNSPLPACASSKPRGAGRTACAWPGCFWWLRCFGPVGPTTRPPAARAHRTPRWWPFAEKSLPRAMRAPKTSWPPCAPRSKTTARARWCS